MTDPSTSTAPKFSDVFAELMSERGLSGETTRAVFDAIFAGNWTPAQIGGVLVALRQRGETPQVVAAAAAAMRAAMGPVPPPFPELLDHAGTGGGRPCPPDVSTR